MSNRNEKETYRITFNTTRSSGRLSTRMTMNKYYTSSLFVAALLLVLSSGGFPRANDSCRSYSEALATPFNPQGAKLSLSNVHAMSRFAFRGGSSSLFVSTEGTEDEVEIQTSVNGKNGVEKVNGFNPKSRLLAATINGSSLGLNGERSSKKFFDSSLDADFILPAHHVAETKLPTDVGHFRLRAYRIEEGVKDLLKNAHLGTEPCVIYSTSKPPFGQKSVPIRVHDQCFTSEVFRSQRLVFIYLNMAVLQKD